MERIRFSQKQNSHIVTREGRKVVGTVQTGMGEGVFDVFCFLNEMKITVTNESELAKVNNVWTEKQVV